MRIILAPAKKMKPDDGAGVECAGLPVFLNDAENIKTWLRTKSLDELRRLWNCSDSVARQNAKWLATMDLTRNLTPAILSYDGIAYQYMAPAVFETGMLSYIQEHLRILSGFYGVLRPLDGVTPYRLEMQAKAGIGGAGNLYEYWGDRLYEQVRDGSRLIVNLASKEYSVCIERYLQPEDRFLNCTFADMENGRLVQKGVYCKMARGEMVRYMAENRIEMPEELRRFDALGYRYHDELSDGNTYIFLRENMR